VNFDCSDETSNKPVEASMHSGPKYWHSLCLCPDYKWMFRTFNTCETSDEKCIEAL